MNAFLGGIAACVAVALVIVLGRGRLRSRPVRSVAPPAGAPPPFRISLAPAPAPRWADGEGVARTLQGFTAAGYGHSGDFRIPELDGMCLRSFFHRGLGSFGVLYDHPEVGLFVDLLREHADGTTRTITSGPETGMDRPAHAPRVRLAVDVTALNGVGKLHERLEAECRGHEGVPARPGHFPALFAEAYSQEMDWRIARGGLTASEIRRAAALGGQPEPDASTVRCIEDRWRAAIEAFAARPGAVRTP
jgi:hypothetical protein